ncbi:glutamate-rich protein 2 isoform X2 [Zootoca vivipara]|uniref:glutamate-rich protein 2 isoform X2 n=1 Tax=Zootoca vivipara TaxID=8524 RepID=UPI00293BD115|nr:glutamate-rich protein 2 isoform X2 [Zootoca vivipara]
MQNTLKHFVLDGFVLETRLPLPRLSGLGRTDLMKEQKTRQNGRLHVFGPKEEVVLEPVKRIPRGNNLKRIARNKNPKMSVRLPDRIEEETEIHNDQQLETDLQRLNHETKITEVKTELEVNDENMKNSTIVEKLPSGEVSTEKPREDVAKENADKKTPESSEDENNEQSDYEVEKRIAPLQLMGEFLKAIMEQKYSLAKKLCQMILIYEPENPEALQFLPLIEKKLVLESERAAREDEETGEGSSEEDSNTDKSDTESESSSGDSDKDA